MNQAKITACLDHLGMTTSTLCAIHCAIVPLLSLFPIFGFGFLANSWLELSMIALSVSIGIISLSISYFKNHRMLRPLMLLLLGFMFIIFGHLYQHFLVEVFLVVIGGLSIAYAHYTNWTLSKKILPDN